MALYTKLSRQQISRMVAEFGLQPPQKIRGVLEGTVNTFYKLTYPDKVYFLKIDEVGSRTRLNREIALFKILGRLKKKLGFEIPIPLQTKNKKYFISLNKKGKKFALIFTQVQGRSIPPRALGNRHLFQIGQALARLHRATKNKRVPPHRFHLGEQERVYRQIRPKLKSKYPAVDAKISQTFAWLQANAPKGLPEGIIHADLFAENIFFKGNHLSGIIDFEAAGRGAFLFDIATTLHACCHTGKEFSLPKSRAFLKGYQTVRLLTAKEKKVLGYYLVESSERFLLTRLRDFALKVGKIKAKPYKNFREYVRRFDEIPEFTRALGYSQSFQS